MALLDLRLREFLDEIAAEGRTPGGGSAAALVTAIAAGLLAKVARGSDGLVAGSGRGRSAGGVPARPCDSARSGGRRAVRGCATSPRGYRRRAGRAPGLRPRPGVCQGGRAAAADRSGRERRGSARDRGGRERKSGVARRCRHGRAARGSGCERRGGAGGGEPHRLGKRSPRPRGGEARGGSRPRRRSDAGGAGVDQAMRTAGRRARRPRTTEVHRKAPVLVAAA